jgi:hypothetical protein
VALREQFWGLARSRERSGLNVHERSGDTASTQKGRAKKMAAPKSGQVQGGNAQEGRRRRKAIPHRNNMAKFRWGCKTQSITVLDKTPQKVWKNSHICYVFDPTAASVGKCALQ